MRRLLRRILPPTVALLSLLAGCTTQQVDPLYTELLTLQSDVPTTEDLGPGDKISIKVLHEEDLSGEFTVSPAGTISYPYVGRIDVSGKTCLNLEDAIAEGLRQGYLANPSVSCSIMEYNSKRVFVFGEVNTQGPQPYRANSTIIDVIAQAGGFSERALRDRTKLNRVIEGERLQVEIPVQQIIEGGQPNLVVLPGDVIFVPTSPW